MSLFNYDDFEIDFDKPLGEGGFGQVFKGKQKNSGKVFAFKRISKDYYNDNEINNMISMNKC